MPEENNATEVVTEEKAAETEDNKKRKIILLAEDEPLLSNLLKQRLEKMGFEVVAAKDGEEALNLLKDDNIDLLLLDIILPKLSGFELMEKLKQDPHMGETPIIIISNLGQDTDMQKGKELGAVGYFVKAHVSIDELVNKVQEFLDKGELTT